MLLLIIGLPIKTNDENNKQIQLFDACNPKETALIGMYIKVKITISLKIPNKSDKIIIIINLDTNKYIEINPYFNSSSLISSYELYLQIKLIVLFII